MSRPSSLTAFRARIPGGRDGRRMLVVALVDRIGSGLWGATAALYFTYVAGLTAAQIGLLLAVAGAIGIAGPPLAGHLADRVPLRPLLCTVQAIRAIASLSLLTTTDLRLLLAITALGSLGDRASSVLTKLYATRVAGPDRARYQAINRTVANLGWAIGGLAAAGALTIGTATAYRAMLIGDALSFVAAALITLTCQEPPSAARVVTTGPRTTSEVPDQPAEQPDRTPTPWRDRTYLLYSATEAVLMLHDSFFKIGLPLWIATATDAPHGLIPLLLVLNNVLVVLFQVPFARFGATPDGARTALRPLGAIFLAGAGALAASVLDPGWLAIGALTLAATAFTVAEMLHSTISWELSVALAPVQAQGAYLGVHSLGGAVQRSAGPLAVTGAIALGPIGWLGLGGALLATSCVQRRLVRDRLATPLSVPPVTVSEH